MKYYFIVKDNENELEDNQVELLNVELSENINIFMEKNVYAKSLLLESSDKIDLKIKGSVKEELENLYNNLVELRNKYNSINILIKDEKDIISKNTFNCVESDYFNIHEGIKSGKVLLTISMRN